MALEPSLKYIISGSLVANCVIGCLGNTLAIVCAFTDSSLRTVGNKFIINLAISDFFICAWTIPTMAICLLKGEWILGETACAIGGFIDNVMLTASVWTLGFSSLNRYFKITKPFAYNRLMNHKTCCVLIALIWIIAVITSGPPLIGWNSYSFNEGSYSCGLQVINRDTFDGRYFIYLTVMYLPIPIILILFSYTHIFITARRQKIASQNRKKRQLLSQKYDMETKANPNSEDELAQSYDISHDHTYFQDMPDDLMKNATVIFPEARPGTITTNSRRSHYNRMTGRIDRATIMIILIIGCTMVTQVPVVVVFTYNYFAAGTVAHLLELPESVPIILHWLLLMNSAADPIIYGLMNPPFKRAYRRFYFMLKAKLLCKDSSS